MAGINTAAQAGTMESNDIMIFLEPKEEPGIEIDLKSVVLHQFGSQIRKVIEKTLMEQDIDSVYVTAVDKGALDITIEARLLTALERSGIEVQEV